MAALDTFVSAYLFYQNANFIVGVVALGVVGLVAYNTISAQAPPSY